MLLAAAVLAAARPAAAGCTSATPLVWVSQPVVQNETALLVATTSSAADAVPMTFARLCPQTAA
jgi:hypothetical protein